MSIICNARECAMCSWSNAHHGYVCDALTESLDDDGHCPFFKTREQATIEREAARRRAMEAGALNHHGLYIQPTFTKGIRTTSETGKPKVVQVPNVRRWLQHLADREIIPQGKVVEWDMKHPDGVTL